MEIPGPIPPSLPITPVTAVANNWRVGQILQAVVVRSGGPQQPPTLQINNEQFLASTPLPLVKGQTLELLVSQMGKEPVLQIRQAPPQPVMTTALKQTLPQQTGLTPLLANIALLAKPETVLPQPLPPQLVKVIREMFERIPQKEQLSQPAQMRQAVADSGIFLERRLLQPLLLQRPTTQPELPQSQALPPPQGQPQTTEGKVDPIQRDFKGQMLRLLAQIVETRATMPPAVRPGTAAATTTGTPTAAGSPLLPTGQGLVPTSILSQVPLPPMRANPPQPQGKSEPTATMMGGLLQLLGELEQQTKGAIARVQLHQLASMPQQDQPIPTLAMELPIRNQDNIDLFQLFIDQEAPDKEKPDAERKWSVTLAFDLEHMGPTYFRLSLGGTRVTTTVWAEKPETVALVNNHRPELARRFHDAGLELADMRCHQGTPPAGPHSALNHTMLDIRV